MNMLTRRTALKLGLSGAALMAMAGPASALVQITVSGGNFTPLPIAIPNFGGADPSLGAEVATVVRNNLVGSGLFTLVDPGRYPAPVGNASATPDFGAWRGTGADAVVMGSVDRAGGQIQASLRLWDTTAGAQVTGKAYNTGSDAWRRIAHIASDAIYSGLTGEDGYFDTRVVYVAESGPKANRVKRLAIMDQDGANNRFLTNGQVAALTPRFSPNQQMICYMTLDSPTSSGVYLLNLASGQNQSLGQFGLSFAPRFSPDSRRIVFSAEQGGTTNLFAIDIGSGQPTQLTNGSAIDTSPSYSPDGGRICFESDRGGRPQIYVMAAGGGGAERISYGEGSYSTPVWSPKGDLIAFTKMSGGQFHIGTMRPDGSGERILTSSYHAEGPTWAPNGRVVMYFRDPGGNDGPSLYSIDIWGRNERRITTETFASDPSWSSLLS